MDDIIQQILSKNPENVIGLEINLGKEMTDRGVLYVNIDQVFHKNGTAVDLPYELFDLCFTFKYLDSLTEESLAILREKIGKCQRGLHFVTRSKSSEYWAEMLPSDHEVIFLD